MVAPASLAADAALGSVPPACSASAGAARFGRVGYGIPTLRLANTINIANKVRSSSAIKLLINANLRADGQREFTQAVVYNCPDCRLETV
jgi:hypothetical protein